MNTETILECALFYSLQDLEGNEMEAGEAYSRLDCEKLTLRPRFSEPSVFPLREIEQIAPDDYMIRLDIANEEFLVLSKLGYRHDDFIRTLQWLRMDAMLKDIQMNEKAIHTGFRGELRHLDATSGQILSCPCEISLYETALVVLPLRGNLLRVPYSFIEDVFQESYLLKITTEYGETFEFRQLGNEFHRFLQLLSEAMSQLSLRSQITLKQFLPQAKPSMIRRTSRLMKEGRTVSQASLEPIDPSLWGSMTAYMEKTSLHETVQFLKAFSDECEIHIGVRQSQESKEHPVVWVYVPLNNPDSDRYGNALAVEVEKRHEDASTLCFFSYVDPEVYTQSTSDADRRKMARRVMNLLDRSLMFVNYRTEPFYLTEEELQDPANALYRSYLKQHPFLHQLRDRVIGRVTKTNVSQWHQETLDLLNHHLAMHQS